MSQHMGSDHEVDAQSTNHIAGLETQEWWRLYRYRCRFLRREELDLLYEITVRPVIA